MTKPLEAAPSRSPPTLRPAGPVLPSPARPARGRVQCPEAVTFPVVTLTPAQSKVPAASPVVPVVGRPRNHEISGTRPSASVPTEGPGGSLLRQEAIAPGTYRKRPPLCGT